MALVKRSSELSAEQLQALKKMESQFPAPFKEYNDFGIRYPTDFLNNVGLSIIFLPLEKIAEFVDAVTKNSIDSNDQRLELEVIDVFSKSTGIQDLLPALNATSIGNLAKEASKHGIN